MVTNEVSRIIDDNNFGSIVLSSNNVEETGHMNAAPIPIAENLGGYYKLRISLPASS